MGEGSSGVMAELMTKGAACSALHSDTCSANSDCEWKADENKCDLDGLIAMRLIMGGSSSGPMAELMTKGAACSALRSDTCSANSDCEWKAEENKCDIDGLMAMRLMMNGSIGGPMAELITKSAACSALISGTCSANSDCEWKANENKCDLNGLIVMQVMMGSSSGGSMGELMSKDAACNALNSDSCSANSDCEWKADESKCDLNGAIAMQLMMSGDNAKIAEMLQKGAACDALGNGTCSANSDCEWDVHAKSCGASPAIPMNMLLHDCDKNPDLSLVVQAAKTCLELDSSGACTAYTIPTDEETSFASISASVTLSLVTWLVLYFAELF